MKTFKDGFKEALGFYTGNLLALMFYVAIVCCSIALLSGCTLPEKRYKFGDKVSLDKKDAFYSEAEILVQFQFDDQFKRECKNHRYGLVARRNGLETTLEACGEEMYQ